MKFKKKPVIVDAFCPGLDGGIVPDWFNDMLATGVIIECLDGDGYDIYTLEGTMHASPGDYIIMGVRGEAYPCKPDIFHQTYEPC